MTDSKDSTRTESCLQEIEAPPAKENRKIPSKIFCPVCNSLIMEDHEHKVCESCSTNHHTECWKYAKGCAIFGCREEATWEEADENHQNSNFNVVDLDLINTWSWLFHIHWLTFVITGYALTALACVGLIYHVIYTVFGLLTSSGTGGSLTTVGAYATVWKLSKFILFGYFNIIFLVIPASLVLFGAAAYLALLPAAIIMRIHFHSTHLCLPAWHSPEAKAVADRVDLHQSVHYVKALNKILMRIIEYFLGASIIVGLIALFAGIEHLIPFTVSLAILILMRLFLLPVFNTALEGRVTLLLTFQNRLVATAKHKSNFGVPMS
jgi:hypothetical protein